MRRAFWCLWLILGSGLSAAEPEVRCYRVGWWWMERAAWMVPFRDEGGDPFAASENPPEEDSFWKPVDEAGFESRFLKEGGEWRDCRALLSSWLGREFLGEAIYDMTQEQLVMRADPADHEAWATSISRDFPRQVRLEVTVFELPFGNEQTGTTFWDGVPEEAKELASLTGLGIPGETFDGRTRGGELAFETEVYLDQNDGDGVEMRLTTRFRDEEKSFTVRSGWALPTGMTWVEKVGSVAGETDLVQAIRVDLVLPSGIPFDEWVLKEEGGAFLAEERLQRLGGNPELVGEIENNEGIRMFSVPPTFLTFLMSPPGGEVAQDPFAASGESDAADRAESLRFPAYDGDVPELEPWHRRGLIDVKTLFRENGVEFREGDFAVFSRSASTFIVKADATNLELVEGIMMTTGPEPGGPRLIRLELVQWEGGVEGKITGERVVRSLGGIAFPGVVQSVDLGGNLSLEAEGQIDQNDEIIELRTTLSEGPRKKNEVIIKTGATVESGRSVVISESRIDGQRRAWVLTARVVTMGRELDAFLRAAE